MIGPIAATLGIGTTLLALVTVLNIWVLTIPGVRNLRSEGPIGAESAVEVIGADERR